VLRMKDSKFIGSKHSVNIDIILTDRQADRQTDKRLLIQMKV